MTGFSNTLSAPPGGVWFWEDGDVSVSSPSYDEAVALVGRALRAKGSSKSPDLALAEYMCPRMPRSFCRGYVGPSLPTHADFLRVAQSYASMPVESSDVIADRLDRCLSCPKCLFSVCVRCHGIDERVRLLFGGRRAIISQDPKSGLCQCAGTYAMVVASVAYGEGDKTWEGTPSTCWRNS